MPRFQRKRFQRRKRYGRRRRGGLKSLIKRTIVQKMCKKNTQTFKATYQLQPATDQCVYQYMDPILSSSHLWQLLKNIVNTITKANSTNRFYVNRVQQYVNFTNQDLGNARVTVYYCIARKDIPNIAGINTPTGVLSKGFDAPGETGSITGATALTEPTLTPFDSPLFCKFYKIYKVKKVMLAPGENHTLKISDSRSRKIDSQILLPDDTALTQADVKVVHWARMTKFMLIRVDGQATNDSTTKTAVGTTDAKVDFVLNTKYSYTWMSDTTNDLYAVQGSYSTVTTSDVVTDAAIATDGTKA